MIITLQLAPEEVAALSRHAQAQGVDLEAVLHELVAQILPPEKTPLTNQQEALVALMGAWREEDKTDDPEELDRRDHELEELMENMNRWRTEEGRLPICP